MELKSRACEAKIEEIEVTGTKVQQWVVKAVLFGEIDPRKPDPAVIPDNILSEMECELKEDGTLEANDNIIDIGLFLYSLALALKTNSPRVTLDPDKTMIAINHLAMLLSMEQLRRLGLVEYKANCKDWLEGDIKFKSDYSRF